MMQKELTINPALLALLLAIVIISMLIALKPKELRANKIQYTKKSNRLNQQVKHRSKQDTWIREAIINWSLYTPSKQKFVTKPTQIAEQVQSEMQKKKSDLPVKAVDLTPSAPTPNYKVLGKMIENNQTAIFLSNGETPIVVRKGDIIEEIWQVETITKNNIKLTYLPLGQVRQLNF